MAGALHMPLAGEVSFDMLLDGQVRNCRRILDKMLDDTQDINAQPLAAYLAEHGLDQPGHDGQPLFASQYGTRLSRGGIAWIIAKYQARAGDPALAGADLSPHVIRHSRAMHLYDSGVPLPYIRDILGHADLATTDIYARASTEAKRKALEAAYTDIVTDRLPEWNHDAGLLSWLASL